MTDEMTPEESGPGVSPVSVEAQSGTGVPPVSDETEKTGGTPVPLFQPLDQHGLIIKHRRTLPHWEQSGCSYFVTFRLADSLPPAKLKYLRDWKELWLQQQPKPWTDRTFKELETCIRVALNIGWTTDLVVAASVRRSSETLWSQR